MSNNRSCKECEFFDPAIKEELGFCRVNSPIGVLERVGTHHRILVAHWPRVNADQWCGRFNPKGVA